MDEDEKEGREIARAMVETINAKVWEWAKSASYNAIFNPTRKQQNYVIDLDDLKEYLGVKEGTDE